jgi:hypothetical protein
MSDEQTMTEEPKTEEPKDTKAVDWEQRFSDLEKKFNAEKSGLMRRNSELEKTIAAKEKEGMSVEERIRAIETREAQAVRRAEAVEAFAKAGHRDEWRQLFDIESPSERAEALTAMLSDYRREVTKELSAEFGREPASSLDDAKREYTMDDLKGLPPEKINKLFEEGRIKGA